MTARESEKMWNEFQAYANRPQTADNWIKANTLLCKMVDATLRDERRQRLTRWEADHPSANHILRRRLCNPKNDARWSRCVHEAGHTISLLNHNKGELIERVVIVEDGVAGPGETAGYVSTAPTMDRETEVSALAAGLAATSMHACSISGSASDQRRLRELGAIRGACNPSDAFWQLDEPTDLRMLRQEAERDLRPHGQFLEKLSEELYARGRLDGATVRRAWSRYQRGDLLSKEIFE